MRTFEYRKLSYQTCYMVKENGIHIAEIVKRKQGTRWAVKFPTSYPTQYFTLLHNAKEYVLNMK